MQWFDFCRTSHGIGVCSVDHNVTGEHLRNLRLIDCRGASPPWPVIDASPVSKYAPLSYIWGVANNDLSDGTSNINTSRMLYKLPKTIEDSIYVTKGLSIDFLWVDRYCINQLDTHDKDEQIQQINVLLPSLA
ncbi:hypothetical protein BKA61DRAFT_481338 [Leptodontidium sp. MPI-SDFR-AT-0119]|nr:hypothetical protein BKA61DRAFT_481338 [Leptodontidium sp. MPI-SDFR-AT-0119]